MHHISQIIARLPANWRDAYQTHIPKSKVEIGEIRPKLDAYLAGHEEDGAGAEFLDLELARRTHRACKAMLDHLEVQQDCWRAVTAAVNYFIEENDAIGDSTIIGFDDDWEIARATCEVLGIPVEVE